MQLRKISPLTDVNKDKAWTRWDKMAITHPQPTTHRTTGTQITRNPAVRFRDDGLVCNTDTDEYFQADEEMLAFLENFGVAANEPPAKRPFVLTDDPAVGNALNLGVLLACD